MNKDIGNKYEKKFVELLGQRGWWCHLFGYKPEGQPCDVVAIKGTTTGTKAMLIDVKHCQGDRFAFKNIQSNQRTCFELAFQKGVTTCGFAIFFEDTKEWRWLSYKDVLDLEKGGHKSAKIYETDFWIKEWNS